MAITKANIKKQINKKAEEIRKTSKSIHEVILRLQNLWLEYGIKVVFTSYPSSFTHSASNSHSAPKGYPQNWGGKPDKPKGYPGWVGTWEGKVITDKNIWGNGLYFSDLVDSYGGIYWIKTGTGGGGDDFRFEGKLFLYDFPVMHKEFEDNGKAYTVLKNNYTDSVTGYYKTFINARDTSVKKEKQVEYINMLQKELVDLSSTLDKKRKQTIDYYRGKFCDTYGVKLEIPNTMFVDDDALSTTITASNYSAAVPLPELESTVKRISELTEEINTYTINNPEQFI